MFATLLITMLVLAGRLMFAAATTTSAAMMMVTISGHTIRLHFAAAAILHV